MDRLIIDPEFRDKIPPLTENEFSQLEENILADGSVFSPLVVWGRTILDGHNRYEIIQKHPELVYAVHKIDFDSRYEAIAWICKNQLGRRNLTPGEKKDRIGQRYEAEKLINGGDRKSGHAILASKSVDNDCPLTSPHKTRQRIAEETHTTEAFVREAGRYAKGLDAADEAVPGIKQEILTGKITPPHKAVAAVAKASPDERRQLAAALRETKSNRGNHRKKDAGEVVYHRPPQTKRDAMRQIAEISAEMERPKAPSPEKEMLRSLDGEVDSFIELCDYIFRECPGLLSDGSYQREVIRVMCRLKDYIEKIEGGSTS